MKRIISIILLSASLFAGNLEVDGGLSVTGEINANNQAIKNVGLPTSLTDAINGNVLQDALRDDTNYEYCFVMVYIGNSGQISNSGSNHFKKFNGFDDVTDEHNMLDFYSYLTSLFNSQWILDSISSGDKSWWVFKRPI
jgi:hypothetical protein